MSLAPEQVSALTILSAFIIASLSIVVVVYQLQWNYFNNKGSVSDQDKARMRTLIAFYTELFYFMLAMVALTVNVLAVLTSTYPETAVWLSLITMAIFFAIVLREISSSIAHLKKRVYAQL